MSVCGNHSDTAFAVVDRGLRRVHRVSQEEKVVTLVGDTETSGNEESRDIDRFKF